MSGREFDASLTNDIFGGGTPPYDNYGETLPVITPRIQSPQPIVTGESRLHAVLPGTPDMPIFEYPDGRKVVRDYSRRTNETIPAEQLHNPEVPRSQLSPKAPVSSEFSLNLKQVGGGFSGDFKINGEFAALLGGLAGGPPANQTGRRVANHQLESGARSTDLLTQPAVNVAPATMHKQENDHSLSDTAGIIATRGLKKVIKTALRPRLASAVLALSALTAGGAYYELSGGELPIHLNPKESIAILQADYDQLVHHPIKTITAQLGRF